MKNTAINIKEIIINTLGKDDVNIDQIYFLTSDNGRNMLKATSLLNEKLYDENLFEEHVNGNALEHDEFNKMNHLIGIKKNQTI